jgi:hypothetical protein
MWTLVAATAITFVVFFYRIFGGRKAVSALAAGVNTVTPHGTIKFDLVGTFDPQLPTIIVITGLSGPKRPDYTNFRVCSGVKFNLLFCDLDPKELQTVDLKHLASTKLHDAVRMLHANPKAIQHLKDLGVDLKTCFIIVDDVSLFMHAKRSETSPVEETTFPGPFVKWILAKTAFKNMLWLLANLLGSTKARYTCCLACCPLEGGKMTFIQEDVMVNLCKPEGEGLIDNQAMLAKESICRIFMDEGNFPADLDKASFLDKICERTVSTFTPEERFLMTARGLAFQAMIASFLK